MPRRAPQFAMKYEADKRSADLADRRTKALLHPATLTKATVTQLVRSAYLQGLNDAIDVAVNGGP
ncbi:MAG: hypothetical protein AAGA22_01140 [Pseudomonadota bacterium]